MKIYEFNWNYYDSWSSTTYLHPEDKTQEEFESDIKSLIQKHGEEYLNQEESWAGLDGLQEYVSKRMPELGYTYPERVCVGLMGSMILRDRSREDGNAVEMLGEELFNKFVESNKKLESEMKKSWKSS